MPPGWVSASLGFALGGPKALTASDRQTRRARLERREHAIVAAARDVFVEHGMAGARMADIARRAKVAEGTIYLYFENKDALARAVVGDFYGRLTDVAAEGVQDIRSARAQLDFLAHHHVTNCVAEWRIIELGTSASRSMTEYGASSFRQLNKTYVAVFDGVVRQGVARGEIREDVPLPNIRDLFYGSLEYACRTFMLHHDSTDPADGVAEDTDRIVDMVWRGIEAGRLRDGGPDRLGAVTERLEAVASQLEAAARSDGASTSKRRRDSKRR